MSLIRLIPWWRLWPSNCALQTLQCNVSRFFSLCVGVAWRPTRYCSRRAIHRGFQGWRERGRRGTPNGAANFERKNKLIMSGNLGCVGIFLKRRTNPPACADRVSPPRISTAAFLPGRPLTHTVIDMMISQCRHLYSHARHNKELHHQTGVGVILTLTICFRALVKFPQEKGVKEERHYGHALTTRPCGGNGLDSRAVHPSNFHLPPRKTKKPPDKPEHTTTTPHITGCVINGSHEMIQTRS